MQRENNYSQSMNDRENLFIKSMFDDCYWYELRPTGDLPERRGYHTAFSYKYRMYVYGGNDIREGALSNMWSFDLSRLEEFCGEDDQTPPPIEDMYFRWEPVKTSGPDPGKFHFLPLITVICLGPISYH